MDVCFYHAQDAFLDSPTAASIRLCGVLGLEHRGTGKQEDGVCLTSLICLDLDPGVNPPKVASDIYKWCSVEDPKLQDFLQKATKGACVSLL